MLLIGVYGVKDFELYEMLSLWASTGDFIWVRHPRQIAAATAARIHPLQQQVKMEALQGKNQSARTG